MNSERVSGFVAGAFGVVLTQVCDVADPLACELSAGQLALFDIPKKESKGIFTQRTRRSTGLASNRGFAKLPLGRCRDLAEDSREQCTHKRETDEGDSEANGHYYFYQTRGRGGRYRIPPELKSWLVLLGCIGFAIC